MGFTRYSKSIGLRGELKGYHEQAFMHGIHDETAGLIRPAGIQVYQDPSLISAWTFDEGVGSTVHDHGPYQNHAVKTGSPPWVADGVDFDGTGTQYFIIDSIQLGRKSTWPDYTIVSWQYAHTNYNAPYGEFNASTNEIFIRPTDNQIGAVMDDGVWRVALFDSGVMALNEWSCMIFSATAGDGNDWECWYNGVAPYAKSLGSSTMRFDLNNFGAPYNTLTFSWDGIIRVVAIYAKRFTFEEAQAVYNAGMYRSLERLEYDI